MRNLVEQLKLALSKIKRRISQMFEKFNGIFQRVSEASFKEISESEEPIISSARTLFDQNSKAWDVFSYLNKHLVSSPLQIAHDLKIPPVEVVTILGQMEQLQLIECHPLPNIPSSKVYTLSNLALRASRRFKRS